MIDSQDASFASEELAGSFDALKDKASNSFAGIVSTVGETLLPILIPVLDKVRDVLTKVKDGFNSLPQPVKDFTGVVIFLSGAFISAFFAINGIIAPMKALLIFTGLLKTEEEGLTLAKIAGIIQTKASAFADWAAGGARSAYAFLTGGNVLATIADTGAKIANTIATGAVTAATWLWNAALSANPIGIVVIAIVALIAIFVLLYNKNETVRNAVNGLWEVLKGVGQFIVDGLISAWNWLKDTLTGLFDMIVNNPFVKFAITLFTLSNPILFIITHLDLLKAVFEMVKNFIMLAIGVIIGYFDRFKRGMINLKDKISEQISNVITYFNNLKNKVLGYIQPIIDILNKVKSVGEGAWSWLSDNLNFGGGDIPFKYSLTGEGNVNGGAYSNTYITNNNLTGLITKDVMDIINNVRNDYESTDRKRSA
ncbi:phage tail tape measure protein [Methanobrevibacter curvatus]|uniref:Phage-related minor tail protein n=1 Tax=Methanobrevibacter curvatus TaxID=49547 RepID=A0A166CB60_9EURY|nr:hypothetical protein [Methanobrevibacter curvatus]KZX14324.1 hypothetical protein MBCUR_05480 [Methanobrevibacter curvatus]